MRTTANPFPALITLLVLLVPFASYAQRKRPPAKVVIAQAVMGSVAPQTVYAGTVYSDEERDQTLVRQNTDLLRMDLAAKQAARQQALADLALAEADYKRMSAPFASGSVSEQEYDQKRFTYQGQRKHAAELRACVDQTKPKFEKTQVRAVS